MRIWFETRISQLRDVPLSRRDSVESLWDAGELFRRNLTNKLYPPSGKLQIKFPPPTKLHILGLGEGKVAVVNSEVNPSGVMSQGLRGLEKIGLVKNEFYKDL